MRIRCFTIFCIQNIVSITFYKFIEFTILLYTLLVISLTQYKEYFIWQILFSNF